MLLMRSAGARRSHRHLSATALAAHVLFRHVVLTVSQATLPPTRNACRFRRVYGVAFILGPGDATLESATSVLR